MSDERTLQDSHLPPAICIMGPTASGKTDLAIEVIKQLPCDIISVDSAMVYCGLDIGTAKPDEQLLAVAPHKLIDILEPNEAYSAAQFRTDALNEMHHCAVNGRIPLLVGGTMLYFRALQEGLALLPAANSEIRQALNEKLAKVGLAQLHCELQAIDPEAAARIHPNDPQRVMRALEVYLASGETLTQHLSRQGKSILPFRLLKLIISPQDRTLLHERIACRFKKMLDNGFIEEVTSLRDRGDLDLNKPSMRAVGYRQVWKYLAGEYNYSEMVERGIIATRQLAKRQLTWLRAEQGAAWYDAENLMLADIITEIERYIT